MIIAYVAFLIDGRWSWVRWTHRNPNKREAIIAKAEELGASGWDAASLVFE
jgi:hypothetical protein